MSEVGDTSRLAARLRGLRASSVLGSLTQRQVADAFGVQPPSLSSWESGSAVPPDDRIRGYARLFSTSRSRGEDGKCRLVSLDTLSAAERDEYDALYRELRSLRAEAAGGDGPGPGEDRGALGGRFFHYANGIPLTILYSPMSPRQLGVAERDETGELTLDADGRFVPRPVREDDPPIVQYSCNQTHPNHVASLVNGDIDALLEVYGHVRAENPALEVRIVDATKVLEADDLSGNILILGQGDSARTQVMAFFVESLGLPVAIGAGGPGEEFDLGIAVSDAPEKQIRPQFVTGDSDVELVLRDGAPMLESDVAFIARKPNPLNASASVTWFGGGFSRGTFGAVRAFTDANLRTRNENYVYDRLDPTDFWVVTRVSVFAGRTTLTPDLAGQNRIRTS